jgi:dienelactone hydrolase
MMNSARSVSFAVWFVLGAIGIASVVAGQAQQAADQPAKAGPRWNLNQLSTPPKTYPAAEPKAKDVTAIYYEGVPWHKKPTRVFAYYGVPEMPKGTKAPGMVLVHGGGGTAFDAWVRLWNGRGYAAIAMDTCGCLPIGTYGHWNRHAAGGPPGWDASFDQMAEPLEDQWPYHAIADIVLAHSLLRSLPQVDPDRIGITGISWGGDLTCIASGVDSRFRFAVPVYGCGFLGDDSAWLPVFQKMGPEKASRWLGWWDPSVWLRHSTMPVLWVTGTNDPYPMDSLQKSYRLTRGPRTLCVQVRMPHGHGGPGENPPEILAFAEEQFGRGRPMTRIVAQGRDGRQAWAQFVATTPLERAELSYTCQSGNWRDRKWETASAAIDLAANRVTAQLPEGVTVYYLSLIDQRNLRVSTEHEEIDTKQSNERKPMP